MWVGREPGRLWSDRWLTSRIVSIGKSGGEDGLGLDRPTVVERSIATIPLPFPVTCTILALLATGPGYFLAHLIESGGGWNQTLAAVFGGAFSLPLRRSIPPIIPSVGFPGYLLRLRGPSRLHLAPH